jgi:FtsZ-interacting cell division protein YlmF
MAKKNIELPELTPEQAQAIVDYLHANYDDSSLDWDNYCCTSDVAPDAYNLAINTFAKAYKIFKEENCDECGKEQTDGKCTNTACAECPEYEECMECGEGLVDGECVNTGCSECKKDE